MSLMSSGKCSHFSALSPISDIIQSYVPHICESFTARVCQFCYRPCIHAGPAVRIVAGDDSNHMATPAQTWQLLIILAICSQLKLPMFQNCHTCHKNGLTIHPSYF